MKHSLKAQRERDTARVMHERQQQLIEPRKPVVESVPNNLAQGADSFLERLRIEAPPVSGILWPTRIAIAAAVMCGGRVPTAHVTGDPTPLKSFT